MKRGIPYYGAIKFILFFNNRKFDSNNCRIGSTVRVQQAVNHEQFDKFKSELWK